MVGFGKIYYDHAVQHKENGFKSNLAKATVVARVPKREKDL